MNKVSFVTGGNEGIASFRYRVLAPAQFLHQHLIQATVSSQAAPDAFATVFSKHWTYNDWSYAWFCRSRGQKVFFDICDDHLEDNLSDHYLRMIDVADTLLCNSEMMAERIKQVTGRTAVVIEDPVISRRMDYDKNKPMRALWYGQSMNAQGLFDVYTGKYPLEVAVPGNKFQPPEHFNSELVNYSQWHPGIVGEAAQRNSVALLPYRQGKNAKSANRVLEALWCGLPVATDPIPAVEDLGKDGIRYLGIDHAESEIVQIMYDTDFTEEIERAQKLIQAKYSPEAIAAKWALALRGVA